jgi:hypothetical protein
MGKHDSWSDGEVEILRSMAGRSTQAELLAALPRRTLGAIKARGALLGLPKPLPLPPVLENRYEIRDHETTALLITLRDGRVIEVLFSARHLKEVKLAGPWLVHEKHSGIMYVYSKWPHVIQLGRLLLGLSPGDGLEADHCSGDTLDNRDKNLRAVSPTENRRNQPGSAVRRALLAGL